MIETVETRKMECKRTKIFISLKKVSRQCLNLKIQEKVVSEFFKKEI